MDNDGIRTRLAELFFAADWRGPSCGSSNGDNLWFIISALRGPDDGNDRLKDRTTWRLRKAIAPNFFQRSEYYDHIVYLPPDRPLAGESGGMFRERLVQELLEQFPAADMHFLRHYADACLSYWAIYE
jgi:hypothetical protein